MLGRNMAMKGLPYFTVGKVVKGFGRGSKDLGIPTANFPDEVVNGLPEEIHTGVYYGWAKLDNGPVHKMVMSIGWNPYFKNIKKSMETHILNEFGTDFYGSQLRVCLTGYIRPEMDFRTLDDLISTIKNDIDTANRQLETAAMKLFKDHSFFQPESKEDKISENDKTRLEMPHRRQPDHLTQLALRSIGDFMQQTGQKLIERAVCADLQNSERKEFMQHGSPSTDSHNGVSECSQHSILPQVRNCDILKQFLQPGLPQILASKVASHLLDALTYLMKEHIYLRFIDEITEHHTIMDVIEMLVVAAIHPRMHELVLCHYPDYLCLALCRRLHRLTELKVLKIHAIHNKGIKLAVRDLVGSSADSLKNLVVFIYENNCTDSILEVLSQNCTQLEHLGVMFSKKVTDQSVDSIKKFLNLKILNIWGTFITKQSCTQLLDMLIKLEDFVSDHKDSLQDVTKRTLGLKSFVTTNHESPHQLVSLCPHLTQLTLHAVHCTLAPLTALTGLQKLVISNCDFSVIETFILSNGEQLISLKLQEVSAVNMTLITYCTQLKTLELSVCSYADRNMPLDVLSSLHYKNLEHLTIRGYYLRNFDILISTYTKLKTLNLLQVPVLRSEIIIDAVTAGKWKQLEVVSFNECGHVEIETLKFLINSCCNLRKIMCKETNNAGRCELLDLEQHLKENNFDIEMVL